MGTESGGDKNAFRYEYLWQDGENYKKPTRLPAPQYMQLLMDWIEVRINDENTFPSSTGRIHEQYNSHIITAIPFPKDFRQTCKKILTRLFRVFVHIYIHHFDRLVELGAVSVERDRDKGTLITGTTRKHTLQTFLLLRH